MKKTNKKGFTIVELVIVIAVIAILAAVLIPTFSGVVEKAKQSAAIQAARNAYTEILAEESVQGQPSKIASYTLSNDIKNDTGITSATYTAGGDNTDETVAFVVGDYTVTYVITAKASGSKIGWSATKTGS